MASRHQRVGWRCIMQPIPLALVFLFVLTCLVPTTLLADAFDDSFYPYRDGVPTFPGLEPGMVINEANVDEF